MLDFDATDDLVHGHQHGRFFHGYCDRYCFLPLYAFCGQQLLCANLRPSNNDASHHTWAILSLRHEVTPNITVLAWRGRTGQHI